MLPGPPLSERRLVFVLGKGGVGKSTVAAALGLAAARAGRRTLVIEVASQRRLSSLFSEAEVGHDRETRLAPDLYGISIDAERATEEYLAGQIRVRALVELLTQSRAFHAFTAAAPGLAELVTLGKIWSLAVALDEGGREPVWDALIVDSPATGHGIALLESAGHAEDLAGGGPIREQAARIHEVVTHPAATGVALVARPEELPVAEAVDAAAALGERGIPVGAAVLNGVRARRFDDADAPALRAVRDGARGPAADAAAAALRHLERQRAEAAYRDRLADGVGVPVIDLPEIARRRLGLDGLGRLADALSAAGAVASRA